LDELVVLAPELIGQPGQPGYRVFALTSQEPIADHFKALDDDQRGALALDWSAGRKLLQEYRDYLKDLVKCRRHLSLWQRWRRGADASLTAHWGWVLVGLALGAGLLLLGFFLL
jgi:hypothetical protein